MRRLAWLAAGWLLLPLPSAPAQAPTPAAASVPFILDHNRMLVDAEFRLPDGSWRKARLWVDTGSPDFLLGEPLARALGRTAAAGPDAPPIAARIGGMPLDFGGVAATVAGDNRWLLRATHADANLPATVLRKYRVVFDYPARRLTLAGPGAPKPRGDRSPAVVNPANGLVQMDAVVDGQTVSLALDNGASASFVSGSWLSGLARRHPDWPHSRGAAGAPNIWGWWPEEGTWPLLRVPSLRWGGVKLENTVLVGPPPIFRGRTDIAVRYSEKTARPVAGFLGANALKAFRVEIDYAGGAVYLEKGPATEAPDMDLVRLTVRVLEDGRYLIVGVLGTDGKPVVRGVEIEDELLQVDGWRTAGATMGQVVDALRGKPGDPKVLTVGRKGATLTVTARVEHIL